MANFKVSIHVRVKKNGNRIYVKPAYADRGKTRLSPIRAGEFYLRYAVNGKSKWEAVGTDPYVAVDRKVERERWLRKHATNGVVASESQPTQNVRSRITDVIARYFRELEILQGTSGYGTAPKTLTAYRARLRYFEQFCQSTKLEYLDQIDRENLLDYIKFLRTLRKRSSEVFSDHYVFNIFQALNTLLRANQINTANELFRKLGFSPKKPKKYTAEELDGVFAAMDGEERLRYSFFLNSGCRDQEVAHTEYADLLFDRFLLHVCPKPERNFRLKGKKNRGGDAGDRYVPLPETLMAKLRARMKAQNAKPEDLVFPGAGGGVDGHFLRRLKHIARRQKVGGHFTLHRFRKTAATTWHEQGVPLGSIMTRLGHTSLKVTQIYLELKSGDQATAETYEQVNRSALAAYI